MLCYVMLCSLCPLSPATSPQQSQALGEAGLEFHGNPHGALPWRNARAAPVPCALVQLSVAQEAAEALGLSVAADPRAR